MTLNIISDLTKYYVIYLLIYNLRRLTNTTREELLNAFLLRTNIFNIIIFFVIILYTRYFVISKILV